MQPHNYTKETDENMRQYEPTAEELFEVMRFQQQVLENPEEFDERMLLAQQDDDDLGDGTEDQNKGRSGAIMIVDN